MAQQTMTQFEKVQNTTKAHTTGGRNGASRGDDGRLEVKVRRRLCKKHRTSRLKGQVILLVDARIKQI